MIYRKIRARTDILKILIILMLFFSSAIVFEFHKLSFFTILQCVFCLFCFVKYGKVYIYKNEILVFLLCVIISGFLPLLSDNPVSYKKCTFNYMVMWIPLYFTITYLKKWIGGNQKKFYFFVSVIKKVFLIQLLWFPLQYIFYHILHIDLNDILFNQLLGFRENVSFIRSGIYYPSGLTWHSAVIAPLFVMSLALFDEIWVVLLVLFDVAICGNTTSVIGVTVYLSIILVNKFGPRINAKKTIKWLICIIAIIIPLGLWFRLLDKVGDLFGNIINRIKYMEDTSTIVHFRYYTSIPKVYSISTPLEIIFGYGNACSGLPHSIIYNQYSNAKSWVVECDVVNKLLSNGIVGFVIYYYFLFKILIKGKRINIKYCAVMAAIIIEGFFYNVQFDYVFLLESIMLFSIQWKIDFFVPDAFAISKTIQKYQIIHTIS